MRITKFDSKKADEQMAALKKQIKDTVYNLSHLTEYAISWFTRLKEKYGQNHPRRTEIRNFANINIKTVVEANEKLYINRADGFVGTGLRKDEFLCNCSDIDDIIIFYKDGKYKIIKVAEKVFVGTDILHIAIFKKNDTRTIYNVVYRDGKKGFYYMKRFAVTGLARDKEYDLTQGKPGSKVVYFTANQNGEAEVIKVQLKPALHLKKMEVLKDLSELAIKSRTSRGNLLTKFEVQRITLKQKGASTLGGRKVWFDPDVLRINYDGQGQYLGEFQSDDQVLVITRTGDYYTTNFELTAHFENNILRIEKYDAEKIWSVALWDAEQQYYYGKRFTLESTAKPQSFIGDNPESRLICYTDLPEATFLVRYADGQREPLTLLMEEFIAVKSAKAKGKRITTLEVASITDITPEPEPVEEVSETGEEVAETAEETAELPTGATEDPTEENTGIEMSINASVPEDSLPVKDEDDQLSLF